MTEKFLFKSILTGISLILSSQLSAIAQNVQPRQDAKKGTWGYSNAEGKWVLKPKFETASPFEKQPGDRLLSTVTTKGLIGFVDENGKLVGPGAVFESAEPISDEVMLVKVKDKYGFMTYDGIYRQKPDYTSATRCGNEFIVVLKENSGVVDSKGNLIIKPEFDHIDPAHPGFFIVKKGKKAGLFDRTGKMLIEAKEYTSIEPFESYFKIGKNDRIGLYDPATATNLTAIAYDDVKAPVTIDNQTFIPFMNQNKWGLVNTAGREVVKNSYTFINPLKSRSMFLLTNDNNHAIYHPATLSLLKMTSVKTDNCGPFTVMTGTLSYTPPQLNNEFPGGRFSTVTDADDKLYSTTATAVRPAGKFFLMTEPTGSKLYKADGSLIASDLPATFTEEEGWLLFNKTAVSPDSKPYPLMTCLDKNIVQTDDSKWHILSAGTINPESFDRMEEGSCFIHVCRDNKWGILFEGMLTVPCVNDEKLYWDRDFSLFTIKRNGRKGMISLVGDTIVPPEYSSFLTVEGMDNHIVVEKDNKYGIYLTSGQCIIQPEYDRLLKTGIGNHFYADKGDLRGIFSENGEEIVPVKYNLYCYNTIENRYYEIMNESGTTYYDSDGTKLKKERKISVTSQWLEHNIYDKNNNKALKAHISFDTQFLLEESFQIEVAFYHKNGKPAINRSGKHIKHSYWVTPGYLFASFSDQWITMPNAQFPKGTKGQTNYYYAKFRFIDQGNKTIPTTGNDKLEFSFTSR